MIIMWRFRLWLYLFLHEEGMLQRRFARDSAVGVVREELVQQIRTCVSTQRVQRDEIGYRAVAPLREFSVVVRQPQHGRPRFGGRGPPTLENLEYLVDVAPAGEQGNTCCHFREDTADAPDVNRRRITIRT